MAAKAFFQKIWASSPNGRRGLFGAHACRLYVLTLETQQCGGGKMHERFI